MDMTNTARVFSGSRRLLMLAAAAALLALGACGASVAEPAIPPGAGIQSWFENGTGGRYVAPVIEGSPSALATGARIGTVLSDTDCEPDTQGLSHCHNGIAFDNGSRITIMDSHQMRRHRCLRPGERVQVSRLADGWVVLHTREG